MARARCLHLNRISGVIQRDLFRPAEKTSIYSAEFTTRICEACGQVEIYCESYREVCIWLADAPRARKKQ